MASVQKRELRVFEQRHTTNVGKLAVLEDEKVLPPRDSPKGLCSPVGPVGDDVAVCLEQAYRVAHVFGELQQFGRSLDVGRQTQVGSLDGDEV